MKLEEIKLENVYADDNNPRQTFEGIEDLAASFDLNAERPGEPFIPPIVVRDGGIYRIVDGERRLRAMKLRKATTMHANVCDDMDEANALVAMVATDDKQPLTDGEKSRGVQQMLLLGVDPVAVDKGARLQAGTGKRVKAALQAVDDSVAAEDMSLDWLLAIEDCADDATRARLIDATGDSWKAIYADYLQEQANAELKAELLQVLTAHGVPVFAETDDDAVPSPRKWAYVYHATTGSGLDDYLTKNDGSEMLARFTTWGRLSCMVYERRKDEKETDPGQARLNVERDELVEAAAINEGRMYEWFEGVRRAAGEGVNIKRETMAAAFDELATDLDGYAEAAQIDEVAGDTDERLFAYGFYSKFSDPSVNWRSMLTSAQIYEYTYSRLREWLDLYTAACADGYEPTDEEKKLAGRVEATCKRYEEADND